MCDKFQQGYLEQKLHTPFSKGLNIRGTPEELCRIQSSELINQAHQRYDRCTIEQDINCRTTLETSLESSKHRLHDCLSAIQN